MKITENIFMLWMSLVIGIVIALMFFALNIYGVEVIIAGAIAGLVLVYAIANAYAVRRSRNIIAQMTAELEELLSADGPKNYSHCPDLAKQYYQVLNEIKSTLKKRDTTRKEITDIVHSVALNMSLENFLEQTMPKLMEITSSSCCAFYMVSSNKLVLKHSKGFGKILYNEFDLSLGEGLVGSSALKDGITITHDIPDDTVYMVRTFLGTIKPKCLMTVPIMYDDDLKGILVLVSMHSFTEEDTELAELIKFYIGVAINNGINMEKSKRQSGELTFQNKLIQEQYTDLVGRINAKENVLRMLLGDIAYIIDSNGMVICWGTAAEDVYDLKKEQAVDRHIDQVHMGLKWGPIFGEFEQLARGTRLDYVLQVSAETQLHLRAAHLLNEEGKSLGITVMFV